MYKKADKYQIFLTGKCFPKLRKPDIILTRNNYRTKFSVGPLIFSSNFWYFPYFFFQRNPISLSSFIYFISIFVGIWAAAGPLWVAAAGPHSCVHIHLALSGSSQSSVSLQNLIKIERIFDMRSKNNVISAKGQSAEVAVYNTLES